MNNKRGLLGIYVTLIFGLILTVIIVLVVLANILPISNINTSIKQTLTLYTSPIELNDGFSVSSASVQIYNSTWLEFDGVNDFLNISMAGMDHTFSFWYKNSTEDWTNLIQTVETMYINGVYKETWNYKPYQILTNNIYLGYNGTGYFNVSIDSIQVLSSYLNSTEAEELYNLGR